MKKKRLTEIRCACTVWCGMCVCLSMYVCVSVCMCVSVCAHVCVRISVYLTLSWTLAVMLRSVTGRTFLRWKSRNENTVAGWEGSSGKGGLVAGSAGCRTSVELCEDLRVWKRRENYHCGLSLPLAGFLNCKTTGMVVLCHSEGSNGF